jgi:hypothetical protein
MTEPVTCQRCRRPDGTWCQERLTTTRIEQYFDGKNWFLWCRECHRAESLFRRRKPSPAPQMELAL